MNMLAYDIEDQALFARQCKNKDHARREVVFNERLHKTEYIVFRAKRYSIKEVYTWGVK